MTTYSPTVERTFCASSGSVLPFQNASDTLDLLISMPLVGSFFLRLNNSARNFGNACVHRRDAVLVSVCIQNTFVFVNYPNHVRDDRYLG